MVQTRFSPTEVINKPKQLTKDQSEAVLSKDRYIKVIAGAGTGKTETLTRRIAYLLLVENVPPASIVAFTFTERAAQSMKERIYETIEKFRGKEGLVRLGEMYIGTIHAYAKKLLEDEYKFGIHMLLDDNQEMAFLLREGWGLGLGNGYGNYSSACQTFLRAFNMSLDEQLNEDTLKKEAEDFHHKQEKYFKLLNDNKLLTFGTVIHYALLNLKKQPEPAKKIKYLVVDEYQDINYAQFSLIKILGKSASVFVVGDPRQSIYQWRGSNERFFNDFDKYFPNPKIVNIKANRRSGIDIVKNANKFANHFEDIKFKPMEAFNTAKGLVAIKTLANAEEEAKWIADQIEILVGDEKKLRYRDVGILTRSVKGHANELIAEFKRRGIRYIVGGKIGLFKRDDALALGQIFTWLYGDGSWGEDGERLSGDDLLKNALNHWRSAQRYGIPKDAERNLRELKVRLNANDKKGFPYFVEVFQRILVALGFLNLNDKDPNDAVVIANVGRFNNILSDYEASNMLGGSDQPWPKKLKGLFWFIKNHASSAYEEHTLFEIGDIDAVQIMTVHQAKGLEWPVVFLFSLIDSRFPNRMIGRSQEWFGIPENIFDIQRYEGTQEDEKRLFYVAITRPKDALVLSYFKNLPKISAKKSRFLDKLDLTALVELKDKERLPKIDTKQQEEKEEMQTFSASDIILYSRCPYQFLLRDVWGYQPKINEFIGYGKALHFCLSESKELIVNGIIPKEAVAKSTESNFFLPYIDSAKKEQVKNGAKAKLVTFATKFADDLKKVKEVEYRIEFPVSKSTITGKVDVILKTKDNEEVRDYKTSDQITTPQEFALQIQLYAIGLKNLERNIKGGSLAYIEECKLSAVDITQPALDNALKYATDMVDGINNNNFDAKVGQQCKTCDMLALCKYAQSYKIKKEVSWTKKKKQ